MTAARNSCGRSQGPSPKQQVHFLILCRFWITPDLPTPPFNLPPPFHPRRLSLKTLLDRANLGFSSKDLIWDRISHMFTPSFIVKPNGTWLLGRVIERVNSSACILPNQFISKLPQLNGEKTTTKMAKWRKTNGEIDDPYSFKRSHPPITQQDPESIVCQYGKPGCAL